MAIKPISGVEYVSHVNFEGKHKKSQKSDGGARGYQTSAMKAVPVVVMLAMSPLNQSAAAGEYNKMAVSPRTELLVQNPQEPKKTGLPSLAISTLGGETFAVWGVSRDDNPDDAETMLFRYVKELGNNKVAVLAGQFLAISDTPTDDGRYLMMYSPIDESGHVNGNYEIAYLPKKFIAPPNNAAKSPANNHACGIETMATFEEWFGEKAVKGAPNIEDATNLVLNKKY